jgi:two-component system, NtrC family, nitrogen regulation sensor histidine kinase NtrY
MHRRFHLLVIVRVLLLAGTIFAFSFLFGRMDLMINHLIIGTIIVLQVIELIRFVNRTNRELARLFNSVIHNDFAVSFQDGHYGKSFKDLEDSLNGIIQAYKTVKIEREAQYHLLQKLVSQINIAIIAVKNNEEISLMNAAAENLIGCKGIRSWKILKQLKPSLIGIIEQSGGNDRKLVEWKSGDESKMLSIDISTNLLLDTPHQLIIIQDINQEIEQKEIEAWHKLIRILTHEIMNSVTPISSLTETTQSMLELKDGSLRKAADLTDEIIADIQFSLKTIQKRSDGLLNFVETYRAFSKVPKPVFEPVDLNELVSGVEQLMREEMMRNKIQFRKDVRTGTTHIPMDRVLVEQVLINLFSNSIHALEGRPNAQIMVSTYDVDKNVVIELHDNGVGIPEKEINHIFIPFFSTRKEGSGIGLSLSKQIMSSHGGTIRVKSTPGEGTSFFLKFRPLRTY